MGTVVAAFCMSHVMFSPEGVEEQAEAVFSGMMSIRQRVAALRPDRLVLIGGDHFNNFNLAFQIPLALAVSDRFKTLGDGGVPVFEFAGDRAFAEGLALFAADASFDLVQAEEIVPDHGMAFPKLVVDPGNATATVLLYVNSVMPQPPSPRRCHDLGIVLREYVEEVRPDSERVVVIGLGGLSHWLRTAEEGRIATAFDLNFLQVLEQGEAETFARNHSSEDIMKAAGNGGIELLAWLVAAGAVANGRGQRLFYEPIAKWITGMAGIELLPTVGQEQ